MRTRRTAMIAVLASAVTLVACSGGVVSSPEPTPGAATPTTDSTARPSQAAVATATPSRAPRSTVYDGRIAVRGDRHIEVRCAGQGTPTILLEAGGVSTSLEQWPRGFVSTLAEQTTVCAYSRAGGGGSSPLPTPITMAGILGDAYDMLAALKTEAGVEAPYLFVGSSYGGTVALSEALEHPEQAAGLVILDTDFVTDFMKDCQASGRTKADCQAEYDDDIEAKSMESEILPKIKPLPGIPIKIVNAMVLDDCVDAPGKAQHANISGTELTATDCAALAAKIADLGLERWSTLGPQVTQTRIASTHDGIVQETPDQSAAVILQALAEARAGS